MAVNIHSKVKTTKPKTSTAAKSKKKVAPKASAEAAIKKAVDAFVEAKQALDEELLKIADLQDGFDGAKKAALLLGDTHDANEKVLLEGNNHMIELSAKGAKTLVTNKDLAVDLLEEVKEGLALEIATFGITDLRKYLTEAQMKKVTVTKYVNARRVKVIK